jgi:hypothetical protein
MELFDNKGGFAEEQAPDPGAVRQARFRRRKRAQEEAG